MDLDFAADRNLKELTAPVTYPEEVEKTLGTPIELKPLDETPLEDLGLNTCNHDIPLSSRESPNFYEPEPQPQPLPSCPSLDINLGEERGLEPPIKPPNDPKKHYGFKPGLLGHSGSLGVDFSNMEMIEDDWEFEPIEVHCLRSCKTSRVEVLRQPHISYVGFLKLGRLKGRRHIDLESILRDLQLEVRRERYSRSKLMFQNLQILFKVDFDLGSEGLRLLSFSRVVEFIKGAQEDHEAEVFQVSNDDTAVAERRLEDKQPKEKTNTNCLVKE
nr:zinc finger, CCHC-type [Tanacetum cinerariifolium]